MKNHTVPDLLLDIETRSRVDLKKYGVYPYVECPDFQILMCAWRRSDSREPVQVETTVRGINDIPGLWDPTVRKVAHNAQFERVCFSVFSGLPYGEYLDPIDWHDTAAVAAEYGWPRKLEELARALGGAQKDAAGTALINWFCKPTRDGTFRRPEDSPEKWAQFMEYCRQDVVTLGSVHVDLGEFPTEAERELFIVDQRINDRGLRIDVAQARAGVAAANANKRVQIAEFTKLTGVENPNSGPQVHEWAERDGLALPDLKAETVEALLDGDTLTPVQRRAMELRQELALVAYKKFATALAAVTAGERLRGGFQFFGAHTGRWAGRGVQPHNMPRASFTDAEGEWDGVGEAAALLDLIELGLGAEAQTLKKLVRALFVGPFTVVDYSAIEARVIAWLFGEEWALKAFRKGRDIYVETAERMGGLTRAQGKVAVLALGFQGSANSLRVMAGDAVYVMPNGKTAGGGVMGAAAASRNTPETKRLVDMTDRELKTLFVEPWRYANPHIVDGWHDLGRAFRTGGRVGEHLEVVKDGKDRFLVLPSGRAIGYHKVGFRTEEGPYGPRTRASFAVWRNGREWRQDTYGGRLAENATQAVARDILGHGLVLLDRAGYSVVGHVHDEAIVEASDVPGVQELMCTVPEWAAGLPLDGAGFLTERYRKG